MLRLVIVIFVRKLIFAVYIIHSRVEIIPIIEIGMYSDTFPLRINANIIS